MHSAPYSILTPWLLPQGVNLKPSVGDGFIMDSTEKLIGAHATHYFSIHAPLSDEDIERINQTRCLVVTGGNMLCDTFTLTPGFTLETLARIRVPVVLVGLGHCGAPESTRGLHANSIALLHALLERFPYMSVRCDRSRAYVVRSVPQLVQKIIMTSCPVAHSVDGVNHHFARKGEYDLMVATVTDHTQLDKQLFILSQSPRFFPARRRILALHQNHENASLNAFAAQHGFEVFTSPRYEDFLMLYASCDLHVGNRVHGHLKALSQGTASFLMPLDLRQAFFAESLDFPLITKLPSPDIASYDFARFTSRREAAVPAMQAMISAIRSLL